MHLGFVFGPILAGAAFGVSGQRYALDEFDLFPLASMRGDPGTVVAVRETPLTHRQHPADPVVTQHRFRPDTVEELVIRLDSGLVIAVPRDPTLRIQAGQRVRVEPLPTP